MDLPETERRWVETGEQILQKKTSVWSAMRRIDFGQLRLLSANTLDIHRNCRHNHMLDLMRIRLLLLLIALQSAAFAAKPALLEIHEPKIEGPGKMSYAGSQPLLIIRDVRAAKLAVDNKGVAICLTPEDTKIFAELTRSHYRGYLIVKATDEIVEVLHITGAILDGCLVFHYPGEEGVAGYLRERLHLKP
jgi:hypothetical protein